MDGTNTTRDELIKFRMEMAAGFARLERQLIECRLDAIKCAFIFWLAEYGVIIGFLLVFRNR